MSLRVLGRLLILLLLASPAARGQGIEVHIFSNHEDETVAEVIDGTGIGVVVKVEVDEELREKKISVQLRHELKEALEIIAKAAGGYLWKLGEDSYRISTKPKPGPGESTETAPAKKPDPAWKKEILARFDRTEIEVDFKGTDLRKILDDWAKKAKVAILLDPHIAATWKKEQFAVHVFQDPKESSISIALAAVVSSVKLSVDYRWGCVFVSTSARLKALSVEVLPEGNEDLAKTLRETKVDLKLKKATVAKAIDRLAKLAKVKISRDLKELRELPRVTIDMKDTSLEHLLALVIVPRGLRLEAGEKGLAVSAAKGK